MDKYSLSLCMFFVSVMANGFREIDGLFIYFRFDHALKLSEIEQLKRDHEVDLSLLDAPQANWKSLLDKERKARAKLLKTMTTLEKKFAKQKSDMEKEHRRKSEDSQKLISELKSQSDSLRKKIE